MNATRSHRTLGDGVFAQNKRRMNAVLIRYQWNRREVAVAVQYGLLQRREVAVAAQQGLIQHRRIAVDA